MYNTLNEMTGKAFDEMDTVERKVRDLLAAVVQAKECSDLSCLETLVRFIGFDLADITKDVKSVASTCDEYLIERDRTFIS